MTEWLRVNVFTSIRQQCHSNREYETESSVVSGKGFILRVSLQNTSATRKYHQEVQLTILRRRPAPEKETETQRSNIMGGFHGDNMTNYKTRTIQGFDILGSSSLFAMSTHGVRCLAWFLVTLCGLAVLAVSGSSLEIQERTSRGLLGVPLPELRRALMWAASDAGSPTVGKTS